MPYLMNFSGDGFLMAGSAPKTLLESKLYVNSATKSILLINNYKNLRALKSKTTKVGLEVERGGRGSFGFRKTGIFVFG